MICKNCNAENDDNSKFCQSCGAPLSAPDATQQQTAGTAGQTVQPASYAPQYSQPVQAQANSGSNGTASLVLGIVSILLCCLPIVSTIIAIIGIILSRKNRKNGNKTGVSTAGLVCSIIGLCLSIFWIIYWSIFAVALMYGTHTFNGTINGNSYHTIEDFFRNLK
jgi:hypothetical protein